MLMRWIWRALAIFLGRKAWEAYQRHQAAKRTPAEPGPPARPTQPPPRERP